MPKINPSVCIFILVFLSRLSFPQPLPQDQNYSRFTDILLDAGILWEANSIFRPLRIASAISGAAAEPVTWARLRNYVVSDQYVADSLNDRARDGLGVRILYGMEGRHSAGAGRRFDGPAIAPFLMMDGRFRGNWYARVYIRATNRAASLDHYSGVARSIARAGLNSGEIDQSVIGYRNDWATVQFGRTREIWGISGRDNLALAGTAPAWEQFMLEGRYKRLTFRYFVGFLESRPAGAEGTELALRYITGRGLQYSNRCNLVIGLTETAVYAGIDRPVDWGMLNPLALELEVEQNHRGNSAASSSRANAVWTLHFDWLLRPNLRAAGSLLVDEFQLDRSDRDAGRTDLTGYQLHTAWTVRRRPVGLALVGDFARLGTYTMSHYYPHTVFSTRNTFIGHPLGNDAERIEAGMRMILPWRAVVEAKFGREQRGERSLLVDPYRIYDEIIKGPFPSGLVSRSRYLGFELNWLLTRQFTIDLSGRTILSGAGPKPLQNEWNLTARWMGQAAKIF